MSSDTASGTPSADTTAVCATSATRAVKSLFSESSTRRPPKTGPISSARAFLK